MTPTKFFVRTDLAPLVSLAKAVDNDIGYPLPNIAIVPPGYDGPHIDPGTTDHFDAVIAHPGGGQYAYQASPTVLGIIERLGIAGFDDAVELGEEWDGSQAVAY